MWYLWCSVRSAHLIIFKGQPIKTVKNKGEVYVSLAHLCHGVGVSMVGQTAKVKGNPELYHPQGILGMRRHGEGYRMIMIPLNRVNTLLLSISPNRCREVVRSTILHYHRRNVLTLCTITGIKGKLLIYGSNNINNLGENKQLFFCNYL